MIKLDRLTKVKKRNGTIVDFDEDKIRDSIEKAASAIGVKVHTDFLFDILEARYLNKYKRKTISVEKIQDFIENSLMREGYYDVARAYITYRYQRKLFRETSNAMSKCVTEYIEKEDWRVNENSNITYSYPAMQSHLSGSMIAHYTLAQIYPRNIAEAHINGDFHIHDLSMGTAGYCAGWSLQTLLWEGFGGVEGKLSSRPPSRLNSAIDQMVNYLGVLQNEWAGAQAFSSFDTLLAPYVKKEKLSFEDVKQSMENFVYGVNVTSRFGQSIFSNISLDFKVPKDLAEQPVIIAGKDQGYCYKDVQPEMDLINRAFFSVMTDGDANKAPFTFPIVTVGITKDFDYDSPVAKAMLEASAKFGTCYFQNYVSSGLDPSDVRSMCCRLSLSIEELRKHVGGIFGAGTSTGSVGVVTINLPRLGYLAKGNEDILYSSLRNLLNLAKNSLELKRKVVNQNLDRGLLPYTKRYLGNLNRHFSTIGVVGGHEMCLNFLGKGIETREGKYLMFQVLNFIRETTEIFTKETGTLYNLEATPAEGTSYRLARVDKKKFPDIITSGEEVPFYTNSSFLPVGQTDDLFEMLDHQEDLQRVYTGGTTCHLFLGEKVTVEGAKLLVKKVTECYKIPYFSITPTFSICPEDNYISGKHPVCPKCGKECSVYSRPVGYLRATKDWNVGKKEEFRLRKTYGV